MQAFLCSSVEQRYAAAQVNDQVQIDSALLPEELDVPAGHFQRQRAGNRAIADLERGQLALLNYRGGDVNLEHDGQLETERVNPDSIHQ
jgi:hypothetical protein